MKGVTDPLGNVALFITCLKDLHQPRGKKIVIRESLIQIKSTS
jgi:small neutral amino acid transporter SnatA (MarC family)